MTLDEFNAARLFKFSAAHIESKDNILFAANLVDMFLEKRQRQRSLVVVAKDPNDPSNQVYYDTRAYQFKHPSEDIGQATAYLEAINGDNITLRV